MNEKNVFWHGVNANSTMAIKPLAPNFYLYKMADDGKSKRKKDNQTKASTSFMITLNQVERFSDLLYYIKTLKSLTYGIAGKEKAPTTGHEHIHMFIQCKHSIRLSINKLQGAHVEKCYGTPQQNKKYVEKGEVIWEFGEIKLKGFLTIEEVFLMSKKQRHELPLRYYSMVNKINTIEESTLTPEKMFKCVKVYYISGESGIGKTRFAKYLIDDAVFNIVKYENGFWIGVKSNGKIALYDDWRDTHMKPSEFLNFVDYNKQVMNIKGGYILNSYELIIITSIFKLCDIYEKVNDESRYQWERRIHEIHLCKYKLKEKENQINLLFSLLIKNIKIYIIKLLKNNK